MLLSTKVLKTPSNIDFFTFLSDLHVSEAGGHDGPIYIASNLAQKAQLSKNVLVLSVGR